MGFDEELKHKQMIHKIALEVLDGEWGCGDQRKQLLEQAGWDYKEVYHEVQVIVEQTTFQDLDDKKEKIRWSVLDKLHDMISNADEEKVRSWIFLIIIFLVSIFILFVFAVVGIAIRLSI